MAEQRPEAFDELEGVWHCHANGEAMCDGPVAVTHSILRWMGWPHGVFAREGQLSPWACWMGRKAGGYLAERSRAGNRCGDMSGIEPTAPSKH